MRKIISCLLTLSLLLLICACATKDNGGATSSENTSSENTSSGNTSSTTTSSTITSSTTSVGTEPEARKIYADKPRSYVSGKGENWTLNNTYKCLTEKKQLNVAYIGGSVTKGTGGDGQNSWRQLTTKWFEETYPNATVNEINAAIGGTGSLWGLFRIEKSVLAKKPDLIFIEFGINDNYCGYTEMQSAVLMDALIRKINAYNPNIDIVLVFTTDSSNIGKDYANIRGHRKVAEYYGVPYINVGDALYNEMAATGNKWSYYAADSVHPNVKGYKVYADAVKKHIAEWLDDAKGGTAKAHTISKTPAVTNPYVTQKTISLEQFGDGTKWIFDANPTKTRGNSTTLTAKKESAKITFEFEGAMVGCYCSTIDKTGLTVTIDGEITNKLSVSTGGFGEYRDRIFFDNLSDDKHTITIEYTGTGAIMFGGIFIG